FPVQHSLCAISASWCGKILSATAMHIDLRAEQGGGHGAALDMPSRPATSPRRVPGHVAVGFVPCLPQREVADVFLFVLVVGDAAGGAQFLEVEMGELSVVGEFREAEVNALVFRLVGDALRFELLDHGGHALDIAGLGRRWKMLG